MRRLLPILVAFGVLADAAVISIARAQPAPSDRDKRRIARGYVDAGVAAQDSGDYATALDLYAKAYALIPHALLLYNQGQAHRLAGHRDEAKEFYRKFLATQPKGAEAGTARAWLDTLDAEDAAAAEGIRVAEARRVEEARRAAEAADAARVAAAEAARVEAERAATAEVKPATPEPVVAPVTPLPPVPARRDRGRNVRIAGIAAGSVGIVALGAGVFYGLQARSISDDLSQRGAQFEPSLVDDGERAERNMFIAYGVGAVLVGGGATLYLLGRRQGDRSPRVALVPTSAGAMVTVAGAIP